MGWKHAFHTRASDGRESEVMKPPECVYTALRGLSVHLPAPGVGAGAAAASG